MAEFKIDGLMKVKTLKELFKNEFNGVLRVYNGRNLADDDATLASIRCNDEAKGGELTCRASRTVGKFIEEVWDSFGIRVKIASPDDFVLVLDGITLSNIKNIKPYAKKSDMEELVAYKHEGKSGDELSLVIESVSEPKNDINEAPKEHTFSQSGLIRNYFIIEITNEYKDEFLEKISNDNDSLDEFLQTYIDEHGTEEQYWTMVTQNPLKEKICAKDIKCERIDKYGDITWRYNCYLDVEDYDEACGVASLINPNIPIENVLWKPEKGKMYLIGIREVWGVMGYHINVPDFSLDNVQLIELAFDKSIQPNNHLLAANQILYNGEKIQSSWSDSDGEELVDIKIIGQETADEVSFQGDQVSESENVEKEEIWEPVFDENADGNETLVCFVDSDNNAKLSFTPYKYGGATPMKNGYALVDSPEGLAVMDVKGNLTKVVCEDDDYYISYPCIDDMRYSETDEDGGFFDKNGNIIAVEDMDELYGVINTSGKIIIPFKYVEICRTSTGFAAKKEFDDSDAIQFDIYGNNLSEDPEDKKNQENFSQVTELPSKPKINLEEMAFIKFRNEEGKTGLKCEETDEVLVPCIYDFIHPFKEGMAMVKRNACVGFINNEGVEIIRCKYDFSFSSSGFSEGLAAMNDMGDYGFINSKDETIIPFEYEDAKKFSEGLAPVKKSGSWGYIDHKGTEIIPFEYEDAQWFKEGIAVVKKHGKFGCINPNNEEVIPFIYEMINSEVNGFRGVKKDGKYGFINKQGDQIVPCEYDMIFDFDDEGIGRVRRDDKWYEVDTTGKIL